MIIIILYKKMLHYIQNRQIDGMTKVIELLLYLNNTQLYRNHHAKFKNDITAPITKRALNLKTFVRTEYP